MRTALLPAFLVSALCLTVSSRALATDYSQPGPLTVTTTDWTSGSDSGKVTVPSGAGPFPILVLAHGFSAKPENQSGWGEHFASYGFIAIAPAITDGGLFSAPEVTDTTSEKYAPKIIQRAIAYVTGSSSGLASIADGTKIGFEGHSAGGQVMTLTAKDLHPQALVLFDPVPGTSSGGGGFPMGGGGTSSGGMDNEPGQSALTQVCSPTLGIFAELANSCNKDSAWKSFALTSTGPRAKLTVKGTNHCDGENAARQLCGFACGGEGADATRQTHFAHYATAWFLSYINGDADATAELALAKLQADGSISDTAIEDGPICDGSSGTGGTAGTGGSAGASSVGGSSGNAGAAGSTAGNAGAAGNGGTAGNPGVGGDAGTAGASGSPAGAAGADSTGGAGAGGAGAGGSSTAGTSVSTGGAGGSSSGASNTAGDDSGATPSSSDDGGCALPVGRVSTRGGSLLALIGLAGLARRRSRR